MKDGRWTTDDEIAFLANLGRHQHNTLGSLHKPEMSKEQRVMLLHRYMQQDRDWGEMDREAIVDYIHIELARIEATGQRWEGSYEEVRRIYEPEVYENSLDD